MLPGRQFLLKADKISAVQVKLYMTDTRVELAITDNFAMFPFLQLASQRGEDLRLDH